MIEQLLMTNPFIGSTTNITRVFDENKQANEYMRSFVDTHQIEDENEFYVLFEGGVLCKKGRSRVSTSDYLQNLSKHKTIKQQYYEKV